MLFKAKAFGLQPPSVSGPAIKPSHSAIPACDLQTFQSKQFTVNLGVNTAM